MNISIHYDIVTIRISDDELREFLDAFGYPVPATSQALADLFEDDYELLSEFATEFADAPEPTRVEVTND